MRHALLGLAVLGAALSCASAPPDNDILYLNLVWHQHQPLYYVDAATGAYTRPWVRVHATKDYYDMAAMLRDYPRVKATFNLTPVLLRQIDDFVAGKKDLYWLHAQKPAEDLTRDERRFILERFFDANYDNMVRRFPGYARLLDLRGGSSESEIEKALDLFGVQDIRDLQVWFNLAWFDPDFLAREPLAELVARDHGFGEADKDVVFAQVREVMASVVAVHRRLQDRGQIEVITTPYAHPILPLVFNSDLVQTNDPTAEVPERYSYPQDAIAHLRKSVEVYRSKFGRAPAGLWPAEGAVSQEIVKLVADAGYRWMATGEPVLARSLGIGGFTRDSDGTVREADDLYRPYYVRHRDGPPVAVVFRDLRLSDLVGFEYSGTPGETAAADFLRRLERIRAQLAAGGEPGPHLVSVILDGENAWEHYPNDGKAFLKALYTLLSESTTIRTTTVSEYLRWFPEQRSLENLAGGAWFSPDWSTWIGEREETLAWEYLGTTRAMLAQYDFTKRKKTTPERLESALDYMYLAEGSDWFWWFGSDQDSGVDAYFDQGFRELLASVYRSLDEVVPGYLSVPIIPPAAARLERTDTGTLEASVDGLAGAEEWDRAGYYRTPGGVMAASAQSVGALYYGFGKDDLYLRADLQLPLDAASVAIYLSDPAAQYTTALTDEQTVLSFRASHRVVVSSDGTAAVQRRTAMGLWNRLPVAPRLAGAGRVLEAAIPLSAFASTQPGDVMRVQLVLRAEGETTLHPPEGALELVLPQPRDLVQLARIVDPPGDDHGPGAYTYPTDTVFAPSSFDLTELTISETPTTLVARFDMGAAVRNPWSSAIRLSLQTFDLYIDVDPGRDTGAKHLLEGRNAALTEGNGWDYAVWVEGWSQRVLVPDSGGRPQELPGTPVKVIVSEPDGVVTILVDRAVLKAPSPPSQWAVAAAVLSQEGFPASGVRRVRDIQAHAAQWRFGGAPDDTNHTRIVDLAWPAGASRTQEEILSTYPSTSSAPDTLDADGFARIPMLPLDAVP